MKKNILLCLLFTVSATSFQYAYSSQEPLNQLDINQPDIAPWSRVKVEFDRQKFLEDYNTEHGKILPPVNINTQNTAQLNEDCFKILFGLKNYYKQQEDTTNYGFTYLNIAKFLLTYTVYPNDKPQEIQRKEFHQQLRNVIGMNVIPVCKKTNKLAKWSHI